MGSGRRRTVAVRLRWEPLTLIALGCLGVALRIAYDRTVARHLKVGLDSIWYQLVGAQIAHGDGYIDPSTLLSTGRHVPTANFPPLYPATVALWHGLGLTSLSGQRIGAALIGGVTVLLTGLLGRAIGGWRIGLPAAAAVAIWPTLIAADGSLMSENLAVPLLLGATLAVLAAHRRGGLGRWALAGLLLGGLALTRSEMPLVAAALLLIAVLARRDAAGTMRQRGVGAVLAAVVMLVVLLPWSLDRRSAVGPEAWLPTNGAKTLAGANCPATYHGGGLGSWTISCVTAALEGQPARTESARTESARTESAQAAQERQAGLRYARDHISRWPIVVAARELRLSGAWSQDRLVDFEIDESRNAGWERFSWWLTLVALPFMLAGCVLFARRCPVPLGPVIGLVVAAALTYGSPRLRVAAEPILLIAAVLAVDAALRAWRQRYGRHRPGGPPAESPDLA